MPELEDEQLDATLAEYFRGSLDARRGGAEREFRRYLKDEARGAWRNRSFLLGAFVSGLAASVAVLWASPLFHTITPAGRPSVANVGGGTMEHVEAVRPDVRPSPVVETLVSSRTSDEGVVMLDEDTPARIYHRQAIERTRWFDENDAVRAQELTPHDELVVMKLVTY